MRKVNCPDCGASAAKVSLRRGCKFYCSQCGWNRENAREALVSLIRQSLFLAALGVIFAVVVSVKNPNQRWLAGAILLAFSAWPLFYAVSARYQLRKLRQHALQPGSHRTGSVALANATPLPGDDSQAITFRQKEFPELATIPRPRKLKTTWKGRGYWAFALVLVVLYTMYGVSAALGEFRISHSWNGNDFMPLVPAAMIYGWFFFFLRNRIRERRLLADGELATGYVTAQSNGRYTQSIDYCFRRADGAMVAGSCHDASRSLFEGMPVAVFYDAQDPRRSVPLDSAMTTIAAL
jgi:hypothetical protein